MILLQNIKNFLCQKNIYNSSQTKNNVSSVKIEGPTNSEKKFLCEKCNRLFTTLGTLKNHIKA